MYSYIVRLYIHKHKLGYNIIACVIVIYYKTYLIIIHSYVYSHGYIQRRKHDYGNITMLLLYIIKLL